MASFVIAEAGVNHNGEEARALELVDVAARAGADAVKFQTFSADKLARRGAAKADYQVRATGEGDQYDMLKALEMSPELHDKLVERCNSLGIEFMSTAFDEQSLDMLISMGIRRIKVPSGEITNTPFLRHMAQKDLPLIVSTGMASLEEVLEAVAVIAEQRSASGLLRPMADMVTILHCTSNYPANVGDVNLRAMITMGQETGLPIGYSDHTLGIAVSTSAVAMGARVIEKHFTIDKSLPGPDHAASLGPDELAAMIAAIRTVEAAMGDGVKAPTAAELPVRALVRRSVTLVRDAAKGQPVTPDMIQLMRPGTGIAPKHVEEVYGRLAARDLSAGQTLEWSDLQ